MEIRHVTNRPITGNRMSTWSPVTEKVQNLGFMPGRAESITENIYTLLMSRCHEQMFGMRHATTGREWWWLRGDACYRPFCALKWIFLFDANSNILLLFLRKAVGYMSFYYMLLYLHPLEILPSSCRVCFFSGFVGSKNTPLWGNYHKRSLSRPVLFIVTFYYTWQPRPFCV